MPEFIVCKKCNNTAKKLMYYIYHKGKKFDTWTDLGYCPDCRVYLNPKGVLIQ